MSGERDAASPRATCQTLRGSSRSYVPHGDASSVWSLVEANGIVADAVSVAVFGTPAPSMRRCKPASPALSQGGADGHADESLLGGEPQLGMCLVTS